MELSQKYKIHITTTVLEEIESGPEGRAISSEWFSSNNPELVKIRDTSSIPAGSNQGEASIKSIIDSMGGNRDGAIIASRNVYWNPGK